MMVGALARLNLAKQNLHPKTQTDAAEYLSIFPSYNIFHNNLAQAIEILHVIDYSIDIINNLKTINQINIPKKIGRRGWRYYPPLSCDNLYRQASYLLQEA